MTQPTESERYSVEYYVSLLKRHADDDNPEAFALRMIGTLAYAEYLEKAERFRRIDNVATAVDVLNAEKRAAGPVACSPECQARPEEYPCLDTCPAQIAARS